MLDSENQSKIKISNINIDHHTNRISVAGGGLDQLFKLYGPQTLSAQSNANPSTAPNSNPYIPLKNKKQQPGKYKNTITNLLQGNQTANTSSREEINPLKKQNSLVSLTNQAEARTSFENNGGTASNNGLSSRMPYQNIQGILEVENPYYNGLMLERQSIDHNPSHRASKLSKSQNKKSSIEEPEINGNVILQDNEGNSYDFSRIKTGIGKMHLNQGNFSQRNHNERTIKSQINLPELTSRQVIINKTAENTSLHKNSQSIDRFCLAISKSKDDENFKEKQVDNQIQMTISDDEKVTIIKSRFNTFHKDNNSISSDKSDQKKNKEFKNDLLQKLHIQNKNLINRRNKVHHSLGTGHILKQDQLENINTRFNRLMNIDWQKQFDELQDNLKQVKKKQKRIKQLLSQDGRQVKFLLPGINQK